MFRFLVPNEFIFIECIFVEHQLLHCYHKIFIDLPSVNLISAPLSLVRRNKPISSSNLLNKTSQDMHKSDSQSQIHSRPLSKVI